VLFRSNDTTTTEIYTHAKLFPYTTLFRSDDAALVAIPGIGARKLEQFGPDVLDLVRSRG
jgi:DNA helicase-2/ATP-dependent DNA helicase PcrA